MASRATNLSLTSVGIGALILGGSVLWFGLGAAEPPVAAVVGSAVSRVPLEELITVHISGAVIHPGVVTAEVDARVATIVSLAGGATGEADLSRLNLAATVRDGDHIVVPSVDDHGIGTASSQRFDLNSATASDFEALPGVGPVLAGRIVAFREQHGGFDDIEDLLDVPGIGEAKLAAIKAAIDSN